MAALSMLLTVHAFGQTLAHPNWVGNGMSTDPWWQHAVIYRVAGGTEAGGRGTAPPLDYKFLSLRVNSLRSVGIDALLLPAPPIPGQGSAGTAQATSAETEIDQLDDLVRIASSRGVRVLLTLSPASASVDLSGVARFWLSRGIAGFRVTTPPGASSADTIAMVQSLRRLTAGAVGQRIVISDVELGSPDPAIASQVAAPIVRRSGPGRLVRSSDVAPQLELDTRLDRMSLNAASLRSMMAQSEGQPNLLVDLNNGSVAPAGRSDAVSVARVVATLSLLTHPAALVDSDAKLVFEPAPEQTEADDADPAAKPATPPPPQPGVYLPYKPYVPPSKARGDAAQPAPKDPLTAWYKQLAALHHGNAAIRAGNPVFFDFDAQNALVWVARANTSSSIAAPVVVACNLSGSPLELSVRAPLESLGLRGHYLRTLLRSDRNLGPQDVATVTLPPYGVYVGELRR